MLKKYIFRVVGDPSSCPTMTLPPFTQHWGNVSTSRVLQRPMPAQRADIALCIDVFAGLCLPETLPVD